MQAECNRIGAKFVLSTVPTNTYNPKYRALVSSMAKQIGAEFTQGNNATTDLADFSDGVHLNARGAEKLSRFIGEALVTALKK